MRNRLLWAGSCGALLLGGAALAEDIPGLVYTPIAPCILVRTAGSPLGRMQGDETRGYLVRGAANLSPQGGADAGCGIPQDAVVVAVSLRVANPSGVGQIKVWAGDAAEPPTTLVDYVAGGPGVSVPALVQLCSSDPCSADLEVRTVRSGAQVRIDAVGYFAPGTSGAEGPPGPAGPPGPPGPQGPVLPFIGSVQFGGSAFEVSNVGSGSNGGNAIEGHTTTAASGVYGDSDNGAGLGVKGRAGAGSGFAASSHVGVLGDSDSGQGVLGESATGNGVHGLSVSQSGVYGHSASGPGVSGESDLNEGIHGHTVNKNGLAAISGVNDGTSVGGVGPGGPGVAGSSTGPGVLGTSTGLFGVEGVSAGGAINAGVAGFSNANGYGVTGSSLAGTGVKGMTAGMTGHTGAAGVWGDSAGYFGVWGTSASQDGVHGDSTLSSGVAGTSTAGAGVWGESAEFDGVHGHTSNIQGNTSGVAGFGDGNNTGVFGFSTFGTGVHGIANGSGGVGDASGVLGEAYLDGVHGHTSNPNGTFSGVAGIGDGSNNGVFGASTSGFGVNGTSASGDGVFGHSGTGYGMATDGPVSQARNQGGWVKAMALIDDGGTGTIIRCFNSQLPAPQASAPPCGFQLSISPGSTASGPWVGGLPWIATVDMGFEVDDRFIVVTPLQIGGSDTPTVAQVFSMGGTGVSVSTWDSSGNGISAQFFIVVY